VNRFKSSSGANKKNQTREEDRGRQIKSIIGVVSEKSTKSTQKAKEGIASKLTNINTATTV
jgi:hypothetical protein